MAPAVSLRYGLVLAACPESTREWERVGQLWGWPTILFPVD
jgi:hypothetical protein